MTIYNKLKAELQNVSKITTIKRLGYNSLTPGFETIEKFLEKDDLHSWLSEGHYDFKYTAKEFFIKLCQLFYISDEKIKQELEKYELFLKRYENLKIAMSS